MKKSAKIAISLPEKLLEDVERERQSTGETRSEFFRHVMETHLRQKRERELEEQYIRGYQKYPETEKEVAWAEATLHEALADSPWEDDDEKG
ncbi:MAG: hypothetical protein EXR55_01340 [Dehalococcoidia bacterium]|nr:hypothetical protein [Dehalococcoidia bacterium]